MKRLLKLLSACALALGLAASAHAQGVTTVSVNGTVTDQKGNPLAGAAVTVVHVPSGTRVTTTTRVNGQYNVTGLRVGGPYAITVKENEFQPKTENDIYIALDEAATVNFELSAEITRLETVTVSANRDATFSGANMSTSTTYTPGEITAVPTVRRDIQDVVNLDTRVGMAENTSTGEFAVAAQGQNSRYNSFLVDGMQSNDPFGLNANGFSSLRSPVPLTALAALTIDLNPYDVTRTGFTGALINAVIKSGTNEFHGAAYTYYTSGSLQGPNPLTDQTVALQEHTYGASFGGPIVKDKLFFFLAFEDYRKSAAAPNQNFVPDASLTDQIVAAAKAYGYDVGSLSSGAAQSEQKTFIAKLDWNIADKHRATFTYRRTDSSTPNFADFSGTSYTSFSNHWYEAVRVTDNFSLVLNSNWTPNFSTEAGAAFIKYNGTAQPNGAAFPEVYINGVTGVRLNADGSTTPVSNGQVDIGTNYSYQLNALFTKDYNGHLYGEYSLGNHTFKFGADSDKTDYLDEFVQYYYGRYAFASVADFAAGTPNYLRYQQASPGFTIPDSFAHYSLTNFGAILQDTWRPSDALTMIAGLRLDYPYLPQSPPYLPAFQTAFGIPNNTTGSGNYTIEPRIGFSYRLPTKNKIQVRGGLGLFQGTNPAVWVANAFDTAGALNAVQKGSSTSSTTNPYIGDPYSFNPDPLTVQQLAPPGSPTPSVDVIDPSYKTPVSWKSNLAVDYSLPWGLIATAEGDWISVDRAIYLTSLNLKPNGTNPDGRIRYSGSSFLHSNFSTVIDMANTDKGGSEAYTLNVRRPMKDHWSFSLGYTHTHATEVQPLTSSVATSSYNYRATVNPNEAVARNSAYVVPDKFVAVASREFNFFSSRHATTTISAIFRAQTGHAFSWVFSGDANNDGISGNDAFYVPSGPDDPKVTWADDTQKSAFFSWLATSDIKKYAGQIVPPNSSFNPWQHTLDLHLGQEIPLRGNARLSLYLDCINFANLLSKRWGVVTGMDFATGYNGYNRPVASATVNSSGQYVYTYTSSTSSSFVNFTDLSRWQLQLGAMLQF